MDDCFEHFVDAGAHLGAGEQRMVAVEADDVGDLPPRLFRLRAGQVDLVDDGNDIQVVVDREIRVRQRLRLDALRGVHQEERTLARRQRARHLVREVDVPRRVDQVQDIGLAIVRLICQPDRMRLDRDAALALEIHRVEDLGFHLARLERARLFEEAVGQRRLAMIDVGDHREVADEAGVHVRKGARCYGARCYSVHYHRASTGTYRCGYSGPIYSARGRIRRLFAYCSRTCAVQPDTRLTAKIGVKSSMSMPSAW